ncbi:MAG: hypothetical protein ACP5JB_05825 [candidate division WOR-3 bacterium]|jgi:hypothetical protein
MRRKLILLILILLSVPGWTQEPEGWLIPFGCAFEHDISGFNRIFAAHRLPEVNRRLYGWGLELRSLVSRRVLFGPLYFRTSDEVSNNSFQIYTQNWGVMAELGVKVPVFNFLTVVPMIGAGGVQPSFQIRAVSGDVQFDTLLQAPGMVAGISPGIKPAGLVALELGLLVPTRAGRYGLTVRGGYLYSPFGLNWRLTNGARVTGTPDSRIRGFWASLGITIIPAPEVTTE